MRYAFLSVDKNIVPILYRRGGGSMEETEDQSPPIDAEEKKREIDLNSLFPGKDIDLNRLFSDEGTRKLLSDVKRNKRDIERFIRNLSAEEE
jgi:hypothetical protein